MAIMTITGDLASGKSMVAKQMINLLSAQYFSTGQIQRGIAADMGMTTLELNQYSETHPEIDDQIDGQIIALADKSGNFVVDSRMAWHFLPSSFKVYLSVDVYRAAERVMADDQRSSEPTYQDIDDAVNKLAQRKGSENKRYIQLYQADCANMNNFDVVVDSTFSSPQATLDTIMSLYTRWCDNQAPKNHYWLSPNLLYPTQAVESLTGQESDEIEIVEVNKRFYLYRGHQAVKTALQDGTAHIGVSLVASNEQILNSGPSAGSSAAVFVEQAFAQPILNGWQNALDIKYLAVK